MYVGLIFGSLFFGSASFGLLCLIFLLLSFDEYFQLIKRMKIRAYDAIVLILTGLSFILVLLHKEIDLPLQFMALIPLVFIYIMVKELFGKIKNPFMNVGFTMFGFIYTFVPIVSLYLIGFYDKYSLTNDFNPMILVAFFLLIWANDTGAYLVGSAIGKHKLMEKISPKKTIEGSLGGLGLTIFGAYVVSLFATQISVLDWFVIAIIVVIFGSLGDLFESLLKRKAEVKDSGKIIPGHGGILDRLDSILFAAPVVLIYLMVIGHL